MAMSMSLETLFAQNNWEVYLAKCEKTQLTQEAKFRLMELESIANYKTWERKAYKFPKN